MELNLKSSKDYTIEFRKKGYESKIVLLNSSISVGYVVLDILGGLIPICIDATTGGWYVLEEDNVNADLEIEK